MINVAKRQHTMLHMIFNVLDIKDHTYGLSCVELLDKNPKGMECTDSFNRKFIFRMKDHLCVITPNPWNSDRAVTPPLPPLKPLHLI